MEEEILDPERDNDENSSEGENKGGISADLIRGHINTIILRTLYERDKYGYEIIEEIESKSHGQYSLKQPTLYSALKRLESQGYINAYWKTDEVSQGGRRKYYTLTDSGREVTERNQAEWEYSRTVIDNLISNRNFDFTQPAPSPVNFKLLNTTTSRIRSVRDVDEQSEGRIVNYDEPAADQVVEIKHEDEATIPVRNEVVEEVSEPAAQVIETAPEQNAQPAADELPADHHQAMSEEEARRRHENYLRLITETPAQAEEPQTPYAESMNTERIIYNNRPETERDYRNIINNLFANTLRENRQEATKPVEQPSTRRTIAVESVRIDDAAIKAKEDGLNVGTSEYVVGTRKKKYNRGATMFKCSLIVGVIMLLEFALSLIFYKELGVTIAYPFVILALGCAQVLTFGVLTYTDAGKSTRKPASLAYLTACIIIAIIAILIIFVVSFLLKTKFGDVGDVMANIVIPCLVALNIPIFGVLFYQFSK